MKKTKVYMNMYCDYVDVCGAACHHFIGDYCTCDYNNFSCCKCNYCNVSDVCLFYITRSKKGEKK